MYFQLEVMIFFKYLPGSSQDVLIEINSVNRVWTV